MTWYYDIADDGSSIDVYDHTGALAETITNDGSGFTFPRDVFAVMETELIEEYQANGFSARVFAILRDAVFEDIQAGTP